MKQDSTAGTKNQWFHAVKVGDSLSPDPMWNATERSYKRLPMPTEVVGVSEAISQSGVVFTVRNVGGQLVELDAGWFKQPINNPMSQLNLV